MLRLIPFACWLIFIVYWIVSARAAKTTTTRQHLLLELMTRVPLLVGGYLIATGGRWLGLATPIVHVSDTTLFVAGGIVCGLGLAVTLWARHTLAGNWSASVVLKEGHELIQRGPYAFVRHPIYSGMLLMLLGTAVDTNQKGALIGVAFFFGGFWWKLRQEERLMSTHFPGTYPGYQQRVKALIPGLL